MKNSHRFACILLISGAAIALAAPAAQAAYLIYNNNTQTLIIGGPSAILAFDVEGTVRGDDYVGVNVTHSAHFDGTLQFNPVNGYIPADGDSFLFFDWLTAGATATGNFHTFDLPDLDPGLYWHSEQFPTNGTIFVNTTPAPEPATGAMLAIGAITLLGRRRSRSVE